MITFNQLKTYLISSRQQILKFLVVGVSSVIIDLALLIFLKEIVGLAPTLAVASNQVIVITYNFILNKYWSFASKKMPGRQFFRYLILVLVNYLSSIGLMYLFADTLHLNYTLVRLGTIAIFFVINFIIYKHWVYKEK